jgi:dolichol-phosphate mannosyltransferase
VKVLKLAGNAGAFNAMFCGIEHATGDALVLVMADLQDPPELMVNMLDYWRKGLKVVIANRSERGETAMQKWVSNTFHGMVRRYALKQAPPCGFDYVLFHRQCATKL